MDGNLRATVPAFAFLLLCGCGGGGSSTPAPSSSLASPVVTPITPTTPVTPSPTYDTAFDPAQYRLFSGNGVELRYKLLGGLNAPSDVDAFFTTTEPAIRVQYTPSTRMTDVDYDGDKSTYRQEELSATSDTWLAYSRLFTDIQRGELFVIQRPGTQFSYVNQSRQQTRERYVPATGQVGVILRQRYLLLGSPTIASDVPSTGTALYAAQLIMQGAGPAGETLFNVSDQLRIDWASGTLSGTMTARQNGTVAGTTPEAIALNLNGRIDPTTKAIAGTLTSSDNSYSGSFSGRSFGPKSIEIGMLLLLSKSDGTRIIGHIVGRGG